MTKPKPINKRGSRLIKQTQSTYIWRAIYTNGDYLDERDAEQGFSSVDQARVKSMVLLSPGDIVAHIVQIPAGAQGVCFRRHKVMLNVGDDSVVKRAPIHCIGWKQEEQATYLFVLWDGSTLLSNDLQAV